MNTAIVGSNGVLNRVAEDGVLTDWFRHPHRKFGATSRTIGLIAALQISCLLLTRGDLLLLGDAFTLFEISEYWNKKKSHAQHPELEKFRLDTSSEISNDTVNPRPGNILVAVRNPNQLDHVKQALEKTNTAKMDIVVLTVKKVSEAGSGEHGLETDQVFTDDIAKLFSNIVALAEKTGKHVELMVVPGTDRAGSARRSR